MHKILQNHLLCAFVANLKIDAIYALYPESFCDKNLAIRKVFTFCDSGKPVSFSIISNIHLKTTGNIWQALQSQSTKTNSLNGWSVKHSYKCALFRWKAGNLCLGEWLFRARDGWPRPPKMTWLGGRAATQCDQIGEGVDETDNDQICNSG